MMSHDNTPRQPGVSHTSPDRDDPATRHRPAPPLPAYLVGLVVTLLFPYALFVNLGMLISGYQAAGGSGDMAGQVTVTHETKAMQGNNRGFTRQCYGDFQGQDGTQLESVAVELPDDCDPGDTVEVQLVEGYENIGINGYEEPIAWAEGAGGWWGYLLVSLLFGVLSLFTLVLLAMLPQAIKQSRQQKNSGNHPPRYPTGRASPHGR